MAGTSIRVVLELDADTDPLQGRLCAPDQPVRPFTGWLALAEAITATQAAARAPGGDTPVGAPARPQH
jgi:hypothetical protein